MNPSQKTIVRGTCVCGRRYRIQNAYAGAVVLCPACQRVIQVTEADLEQDHQRQVAAPGWEAGDLLPLGAEPIDHGVEEPAPAAASPLQPGWTDTLPETEAPSVRRSFTADLLASFYFAGRRQNALSILLSAVACSLDMLFVFLLWPLGPFVLLAVIPLLLVAIYIMQFYWSILLDTVAGEDVIPWVRSDFDLWDDCVKPALWLLAIGVMCSLPAWAVVWLVPPTTPWRDEAYLAALLAGWFFWPVAVMSVALGETILFARPDWLVRCIVGIGPAYLLAWALVMLLLAGWRLVFETAWDLTIVPLVGPFVNLYVGYVLFRTLGLLFRHYRERFPWRF